MSYNDYNGDGDDFDEDYQYFDVEELTDDEQQLNDVEILNELEDKYETEEIDDYEDTSRDIKIRKIKDSYRQTNNILTKYEKARVLGIRSLQLSLNFKPMIKTDISDTYEIAKIELKNKIIPLKIKRYINKYEYEEWNVNDLIDLHID
jgi:DNA-directed RNA polymerase I, II, and III subunit RPABC2